MVNSMAKSVENQYEEKRLVSQIKPLFRRLDILANMFQGKSKSAALCYDGEGIKLALNQKEPSELAIALIRYLKNVASVDYTAPGFISRLNEERTKLLRYAEAQTQGDMLSGWVRRFKTNLLRTEGSIHGYRIQQDHHLASVFHGQEYREEVAFPENIVEALKNGIMYIPGKNGVHSELKIAQHLLYNNYAKLESGEKFYIATSKKCCRNCEAAIKAINNAFSETVIGKEAPNYSESTLPGANLSIATKESLVGIGGSREIYPSPIPPFMIQNDQLSQAIREKIVRDFLINIGRDIRSDLKQVFSESQRISGNLLHSFSLSPTYRITETSIEEPPAITKKISNKSYVDLIRPEARALPSSNKIDSTIDSKAATEEKSTIAVSTKTNKSKKKKKKAPETKPKEIEQKDNDEIFSTIEKESTQQQLLPQEIAHPIIIFYERTNDSTSAEAANSIISELETANIKSLALYDQSFPENADLKSSFKAVLGRLYKAGAEKPTITDNEEYKNVVKTYKANYSLVNSADKNDIQTCNITLSATYVKEIAANSSTQIEQQKQQLRAFILKNKLTEEETCRSREAIEIFDSSLLNQDNIAIGEHIANKLIEICNETGKGVVAIIEWNKAKILEEQLTAMGCSNITSFFIYRKNALDELPQNSLNFNMLKYNPDHVNSAVMPNSTIIDATEISEEELKNRITECIRPVTINTIVEYQPELPQNWQERTSRSRTSSPSLLL